MPSVVYGPGTREGMAAELPPRPTSVWDFLLDHAEQLDVHELRRAILLVLRAVVGFRLEDLGRVFELHKGHVSREIDRARGELSESFQDMGLPELRDAPELSSDQWNVSLKVWVTEAEAEAIRERAKRTGTSVSAELRRALASAPQPAAGPVVDDAVDDAGRTAKVTVRLTAVEIERIRELAGTAGVAPATHARCLLLERLHALEAAEIPPGPESPDE